jgi:hypothetical protein
MDEPKKQSRSPAQIRSTMKLNLTSMSTSLQTMLAVKGVIPYEERKSLEAALESIDYVLTNFSKSTELLKQIKK